MDHICYFCLVLLYFRAPLFIDTLWSPAGKGLTSWLSFVNCEVFYFSIDILGQVWCLIVSIAFLLQLDPEVMGVCKVNVSLYCLFPLNLVCTMTTFRFFSYLLVKPQVEGVRAWCSMLHSL